MITVEITKNEIGQMLGLLMERTGNLTPVMNEIGQIVRNSVIKNFQEGGRPRWKPHSQATILGGILRRHFTKKGRLKEPVSRKLRGGKVLIDTGHLMSHIKSKAYPDRAEIGTNVIYAAIHQFGGKAGRGKKVTIPARPFLMVQPEDWEEIKKATLDYLMGRKR